MLDYIGQNKIAAKWLLECPERKQQYLDKMSEFSVLGAVRYSGMPTGTDVGRPCENMGLSLVKSEESKLWIMTVEDTESTLGDKKLAFLDIRRLAEKLKHEGIQERGRPAWVPYTQERYADWHHRKYGGDYMPASRDLYRWWTDIVNIAVRIAIKRGCL
jgi:hypothetical protein